MIQVSIKGKIGKRIRDAESILIIPFPAAMWGSEYCPEQNQRLDTTLDLYQGIISWRGSNRGVKIMLNGGLPDRYGITLARCMAGYLVKKMKTIENNLQIGEKLSTHTGEQVRMMKQAIIDEDYDLIFVVSNWWHLRGILKLMKNVGYPMPVIGIPSPTAGSIPHRLSRAIQETIRLLTILTFDPQGHLFDADAKKRKFKASSM